MIKNQNFLCYEYLTFLKGGSILDLKHLIIVLNIGFW